MKSLKKTLVLLVVFAMILSTVMPAFAASSDTYGLDCEEEVARLQALKIVSGYEDGTFKPENTITRAEMAVILCKMVGIDEVTCNENKSVPSKFSDVAVNEWYTGYINVAAGKGFLSGFPDGTFRPNDQLTMNQVLTLCVNALGRGEYVSTMGAWPANYITEATKLGLLDGVKTSDANRGNVAIIVWNTLEAPYVWDVTNTEYEGTINLGNSTRSLLSIYFRDYSYDNALGTNRYLKEAQYMQVAQVPSTDGTIGEYQITLTPENPADPDIVTLLGDIAAEKQPRGRDDKEWTRIDGATGNLIAYAPEFDNLDSFYGKVVTVIFGKDNEVVSIRVIDETVEDETLTAWEDDKLTIGGKEYKFAGNAAEVYINTVNVDTLAAGTPAANMNTVADILDDGTINASTAWNWKNFNKTIKANVVLNNNGKVTRLDLFVSGDYDDIFTHEYVVSKVKNEVISLKSLNALDTEIDYSEGAPYEDEDDRPRVMKDGKIISLEDIEAGDVLTCYYEAPVPPAVLAAGDPIKTILVSSETKEGKLTRTSKADFKMTVDGDKYYASLGEAYGNFLFTEDKIADAVLKNDATSYIDENITLYLNVYGEYALMISDKEANDWVFGIIKQVRETEDDEEDDNLYYIPARILLADGTVSRTYKFVYDDEEDGGTLNAWERAIAALEDEFVVFTANANNLIEYGDYAKVTTANLANNAANVTDKDYFAVAVTAGNAIDEDRERITADDTVKYTFGNDSVIFNTGKGDDPSVNKKFDILVTGNPTVMKFAATLVYEKDAKTISYLLIDEAEDDYAASDALYAVVAEDDYKEKDGATTKKYVDLILADETEAQTYEAKNTATNYVANMEDMIVEFKLSSSKLESASLLIDLPAFKKLKATGNVTDEVVSGTETKLVVDFGNVVYTKVGATAGDLTVIADTKTAGAGEIALADVEAANTAASVTETIVDGDKVNDIAAVTITAGYAKVDAGKQTDGDLLVVADSSPLAADPTRYVEVATVNAAKATLTTTGTAVIADIYPDTTEYGATDAAAGDYVRVTTAETIAQHYAKNAAGTLTVVDETAPTVKGANEIRLAEVGTLDEGGNAIVGDLVKVAAGTARVKDNFKVIDTDKLLLTYADDDSDGLASTFGEVIIDKDVVVYDARTGVLVETTFDALVAEIEEDGGVYVIPYANEDAEGYNTANVEANVLFIVK